MTDIQAAKDALATGVQMADAALDEQDAKLSGLSLQVDSLSAANISLQAQIATANALIADLQAQIAKLQSANDPWAKVDKTGATDVTAQVQALIDQGLPIPSGRYLIDPVKSLMVTRDLSMAPDAVLIAKANAAPRYYVLQVPATASDLTITGGQIIGDRDTHNYVKFGDYRDTHEWGMGIGVRGAKRITVKGTKLSKLTGDGVCVAGSDVILDGVESDSNRRQGCSITNAQRVTVKGGRYTNTNGTKPGHGIDIEPDAGSTASDIIVDGAYLGGNAGDGVEVHDRVTGVTIKNCLIEKNKGNGIETAASSTILMQDNTIKANGWDAICVKSSTTGYTIQGNSMGGNRTSTTMPSRAAFDYTGTSSKTGRDLELSSSNGKVGLNHYLAQPLAA